MTFMFGMSLVFVFDEHVERCSPGSEVKAIVNEFLMSDPGQPADIEALQKIASDATPNSCGITFPLHSHDDEIAWPNKNNATGLVLYGLGISVVGAWVFRRGPKDREPSIRDPKV